MGTDQGAGVVSPTERGKAEAALPEAAAPAKGARTAALGQERTHSCWAAATLQRSLGTECLPAATHAKGDLTAHKCFDFNKFTFNTSQGNLALFQAMFCLF